VLQAESSPTDLAISGGGFFVVNNSAAGTGNVSFTRAGNFTVDANGNLVNSAGNYLQGQTLTQAQSNAIAGGNYNQLTATSLGALTTVNVSSNAGTAQATANVSLVATLPANDAATPETMTVPVYDSLGVAHDMTLTFTPTATANQWSVSAAGAGMTPTIPSVAGVSQDLVQFNPDGTLDTAATTFGGLSIAWTAGGATSPQAVNFNLGTNNESNGLSQIGTTFTVGNITQDGVKFGNFSGVSIDTNGIVSANYDNGLSRAIYILPVATFANPDGLDPQSGNTYSQTINSGSVLLRQAGTGAAGTVAPSTLENSTVDIATEFSNLIITQRAYEANSKIITTADQMLQTLIQAKQ
jgi:flagellar hook protein FlgE